MDPNIIGVIREKKETNFLHKERRKPFNTEEQRQKTQRLRKKKRNGKNKKQNDTLTHHREKQAERLRE